MPLAKLSVALQPQVIEALAALATDQQCSKVEALRRAILTLRWLSAEHAKGNALGIVSPDGKVREVRLVGLDHPLPDAPTMDAQDETPATP
jgi:hypothetical protein